MATPIVLTNPVDKGIMACKAFYTPTDQRSLAMWDRGEEFLESQGQQKRIPVKAIVKAQLELPAFSSNAVRTFQLSPPRWDSAILSNTLIFLAGSPLLVAGLTTPGIGVAFTLGSLSWRSFGVRGFCLVVLYYHILVKCKYFLITINPESQRSRKNQKNYTFHALIPKCCLRELNLSQPVQSSCSSTLGLQLGTCPADCYVKKNS
eukprot:Gb_36832 [translate_table: standard]